MKLRQLSMSTFIIVLSILALSCSPQKAQWQGTIEEVDGVTVVKNPIEPMYGEDALELDEELSIGEAEGKEEYMFSGLRQLAIDDRGHIFALDMRAKHVKVFTRSGEYLKTIGKEGQGPGEFHLPAIERITSDNKLMVLEMMKISYFTLEGEFIRSQNTSAQGVALLEYDKFNNPIGMRLVLRGDNPRADLVKFNSEFEETLIYDSSPLAKRGRFGGGFNPFLPILRWSLIKGEKIVCGNPGERYKLKVFDLEGNLTKEIHKQFNRVNVTDEDIEYQMRRNSIESREQISAPDYKPPFRWIDSDEEGRIFVSTWERFPPSEGYCFDVFDAEGKYLLRKPIEGDQLVFKNGKLYIIYKDEDGYQ